MKIIDILLLVGKLIFIIIPQTLAFYEFLLCCIVVLSHSLYLILYLGEYTNETRMALDITWLFIFVHFSLLEVKRWRKENKKINEDGIFTRFIFSGFKCGLTFFPLWILFLIFEPNKIVENCALHDSHEQIGIIFKKYTTFEIHRQARRSHHLDIGISSSQTREHLLNRDNLVKIFESMNAGDTVILRVSDKFPRVNKVLNWHPTRDEIERYRMPVELVDGI